MSGTSDAKPPFGPRFFRSAAGIIAPRRPAALSAIEAVRLFVAIDSRRPASWIALVAGAVAGRACGSLAAGSTAAIAAAVLAAAATAVAAIGDLPLDLFGAPLLRSRRGRRWVVAWAAARAVWPLAGFAAGMLPFAARGVVVVAFASGACAALAAAVTVARVRLAGAGAADAASVVLAIAAASGAAACAPRKAPLLAAAAAAIAWLACGAFAGGWSRLTSALGAWPLDAFGERGPTAVAEAARGPLARDPFPAAGPLRHGLERLAMASALVAMAGWLVLEPEHAGSRVPAATAWACLSIAWFVALVAPAATLQDGAAGSAAWQRLFRAAATRGPADGGVGPPRSIGRRFGDVRPGTVRFAAGAALAQAAILGWPPLVCALVTLPSPGRAVPPALIVALLVAAAVTTVAVVAVAVAVGMARETMFACLVGLAVGAAVFALLRLGSWDAAAAGDWRPAVLRDTLRETARPTQIPPLARPTRVGGSAAVAEKP